MYSCKTGFEAIEQEYKLLVLCTSDDTEVGGLGNVIANKAQGSLQN